MRNTLLLVVGVSVMSVSAIAWTAAQQTKPVSAAPTSIDDVLRAVRSDLHERIRVPSRQLVLHLRHLVGESRRQRLNGFVLRLLPQPLVPAEHGIDRGNQRSFEHGGQAQMCC